MHPGGKDGLEAGQSHSAALQGDHTALFPDVIDGVGILEVRPLVTHRDDGVAVLDLMEGTVTTLEDALQAAKGNDSLEGGIKKALKAVDSFERARW